MEQAQCKQTHNRGTAVSIGGVSYDAAGTTDTSVSDHNVLRWKKTDKQRCCTTITALIQVAYEQADGVQ